MGVTKMTNKNTSFVTLVDHVIDSELNRFIALISRKRMGSGAYDSQ